MTLNDSNNNDVNKGDAKNVIHTITFMPQCSNGADPSEGKVDGGGSGAMIVHEPLIDFINDLTETRRRVWRVPWFILIMSALQIIVYAMAVDWLHQHLIFSPETRRLVYPYASYMLLHSDLVHLLLNLSLQSSVGIWLECEQGHWRLMCVYFAGGVSGSLAIGWWQPHLSILGASAGVYAMLTSHMPHMWMNFRTLPYRYLRVAALVILCLSDIGFTAYHYLVNGNTDPRICAEAHMAGALAGLVFGFAVYHKYKRPNVLLLPYAGYQVEACRHRNRQQEER